jgi:AraC-like DNA-binding protein
MTAQDSLLLNVKAAADAVPRQGKIRTGYFRGFKNLVHGRGGDARVLLERHGLDPLSFETCGSELDCSTAVALFEDCSRSLGDPLFGFHLAEQQQPDVFGYAMALARAAPTLRQGLQSLIDYVPLAVSPECELELVTARNVTELRWRTQPQFADCEQMYYQGLLLLMKTLQALGREQFRAHYVDLLCSMKQADVQFLQQRLGCRVQAGAALNAIAFAADALERPIATADRVLFSFLRSCLPQIHRASEGSFLEQVEGQVRRQVLSMEPCSIGSCALKLGIAARTLQKRLTALGVQFSDIVQKQRVELAQQALLWSASSLDEIAFQLGYAEQSTFGRAFKRVTGLTPQAFRQAHREFR